MLPARCLFVLVLLAAAPFARAQSDDDFKVRDRVYYDNGWATVTQVHDNQKVDLTDEEGYPETSISTSVLGRAVDPGGGFHLKQAVTYNHSPSEIVATYLNGKVALYRIKGQVDLAQLKLEPKDADGFKVRDHVYYESGWATVTHVYDDHKVDLTDEEGYPETSISTSVLGRAVDPGGGFHLKQAVTYNHSPSEIVATYLNGKVALYRIKGQVDLAQLKLEPKDADGFKVRDHVYYESGWATVTHVYDDHKVDLTDEEGYPAASISTSVLGRAVDPGGGFHLKQAVIYNHSPSEIVATYLNGKVALYRIKGQVDLAQLKLEPKDADGFKVRDHVYYESGWATVTHVYDDHKVDLTDEEGYPETSISTSVLGRAVDPGGGFHLKQAVTYNHSPSEIVATYLNGKVALYRIKGQVDLAQLKLEPKDADGFKVRDHVYYESGWATVTHVYDDHKVDLTDEEGYPETSISTSVLGRAVDPGGGFHLKQAVIYNHSPSEIVATYLNGKVALYRIKGQVDLAQLKLEPKDADGFKVRDHVYYESGWATVTHVYDDHKVDLTDEEGYPETSISTSKLGRAPGKDTPAQLEYQGANHRVVAILAGERYVLAGVRGAVTLPSAPAPAAAAPVELAPVAGARVWGAPTPIATAAPAPVAAAASRPAGAVPAAAGWKAISAAPVASAGAGSGAGAGSSAAAELPLKGGEVRDITRSSRVFSRLVAVAFPRDLARGAGANAAGGADNAGSANDAGGAIASDAIDAMAAEIARCGVSIEGPACLDSRFQVKDVAWVSETGGDGKYYFAKSFTDSRDPSRVFVALYEAASNDGLSPITSAAIYAAPAATEGAKTFYGLLKAPTTPAPILTYTVPADSGRAALETLEDAQDPVTVYHAFAATLATQDPTLASAALEAATPHAGELATKLPAAYREPLTTLIRQAHAIDAKDAAAFSAAMSAR